MCEWLPSWKKRNWKLPSGEPVKNRVDFEELDQLMIKTDMTIKWVIFHSKLISQGIISKFLIPQNYVRAHKGLHGNEMADQLAKEGASLYKIKNK